MFQINQLNFTQLINLFKVSYLNWHQKEAISTKFLTSTQTCKNSLKTKKSFSLFSYLHITHSQ